MVKLQKHRRFLGLACFAALLLQNANASADSLTANTEVVPTQSTLKKLNVPVAHSYSELLRIMEARGYDLSDTATWREIEAAKKTKEYRERTDKVGISPDVDLKTLLEAEKKLDDRRKKMAVELGLPATASSMQG
jgi:hypothetical protein